MKVKKILKQPKTKQPKKPHTLMYAHTHTQTNTHTHTHTQIYRPTQKNSKNNNIRHYHHQNK